MTRNSTEPRQIFADWHLELNAECPSCGERGNLLRAVDFWDSRRMEICETDTPDSDQLKVHCPKCYHDFSVCCRL